jgi:hypothetical protein
MARVITDITVHQPSTTALAGNLSYRGVEWHSPAKPDYEIFIYNCSRRTFADPLNPNRGIVGRLNLLVPGVEDDDPTDVTIQVKGGEMKVIPGNENHPYHYVASFPHPVLVHKENLESGELEVKETDGRRFVVDLISPDNLGVSLDVIVDPTKAFSVGNDYSNRGIFFSYTKPPMKDDVEKAYARMERHYSQLNEIANTLEMSDKAALQRAVSSNPDHIYAANYYGKPFAWASKAVRPVDCIICGEQKKAGQKFHRTSFGTMCVEPTQEAWKMAVSSGNKEKSQVPDEFRWFKEKEAS